MFFCGAGDSCSVVWYERSWCSALLSLLKEGCGFSFDGKASGALFLVEEFAVFTNLEDTALSGDEGDVLVGHGFDFGRHTVSFGEVVSLGAIFDLDHGARKMKGFEELANEKLRVLAKGRSSPSWDERVCGGQRAPLLF